MDQKMKRFQAAKKAWERDNLTQYLQRMPEREQAFSTTSGLPLDTLYTPTGDPGDYADKLGFPGEYPYTRGVFPSMYRSQMWVMGMYSGFGSAEEANERYRYLLSQGQTGFSIALDLPTQMGYDSDHRLARGEVGRSGVALCSLDDMERLFAGIPLEQVRQIRTTANAIGPIFTAMFIALAKKNGRNPGDVKMFIQNDVLKEYIARGTYIVPPAAGVKLAVDVVEYAARHLPAWTSLAISGYHIRDSGSTAPQELAFSIANAIAYIEEARRRGLATDEFAPNLFTFLSAYIDFLEEVAKFRAARRIWAKLLKGRFGAVKPESLQYKIFAYTLGGALTAQQPLNNIARVAIETLAAVLGGVQTIATSSYDEAFSIPTEAAATVALRTQQIVAHEAGVTGTVDALGGSYAIESLTDRIEAEVWQYLEQVDALGGAVAGIDQGYFQRELSDAAYRFQRQVDSGQRVIVGQNKYRAESDPSIPIFEINEQMEQKQADRIRKLKADRDRAKVEAALRRLEDVCRADENRIPAMIEVIEAYGTIGEISDVLRKVYGVYHDPAVF